MTAYENPEMGRLFSELELTYMGGRREPLRRCGSIPDLFASREGNIYQLVPLRMQMSGKQAVVKYRNRTMAARYLVADAWKPGWDQRYRTVALHNPNYPMDVSPANLSFTSDARRGRPRSDKLLERARVAMTALMTNSIDIASEEFDMTPMEVFDAVEEFFPNALVDMEGVPDDFKDSTKFEHLVERSEAIKRAKALRDAERKAQRDKLARTPEDPAPEDGE